MTQFDKACADPPPCDLCGAVMIPLPGGGWDNDRMACPARDCGAEIVYPTTSPPKETQK